MRKKIVKVIYRTSKFIETRIKNSIMDVKIIIEIVIIIMTKKTDD